MKSIVENQIILSSVLPEDESDEDYVDEESDDSEDDEVIDGEREIICIDDDEVDIPSLPGESLERLFARLVMGFNDDQESAMEDYKAASSIMRFNISSMKSIGFINEFDKEDGGQTMEKQKIDDIIGQFNEIQNNDSNIAAIITTYDDIQYDDKGNYLKANKINKIKLIPSEKNFTII